MSDDVKRLGDISKRINSINKICEKYGGIYEALENFEEAQPAIMMHLIVCNENIDKLMYSDEIDIKSILSQKELRGIKAIRNIAAHDYEGLDFSIIHDVVKYYLPSIKTNIDRFLLSQKETSGGSNGS
ncbi:HepT-like ribonuclease domain-containing protein [Campylobacter hyointestinalis]|uniref:HepT-like ribonuclease domain-containing protein n=1 Tax=Campylobacter hyointestinalis TaxID=198 RepID=UPI00202397D2|nr:HepT-like ribonuclease domain-containing protein [Campylobacter hyointestinalis]MDY2999658.1 HepT-like ribonuclease domain-containing protein [Campylobacter hyointestinalis]